MLNVLNNLGTVSLATTNIYIDITSVNEVRTLSSGSARHGLYGYE